MKKVILNADDFAKDKASSDLILKAFDFGVLKSASVMVNYSYFNELIKTGVFDDKNISFGLHLNLNNDGDNDNNFSSVYKFITALIGSFNSKYLKKIEDEFRKQIEFALKHFKPTHIDSHIHIHAIPNIFKIILKLASEYQIENIRMPREKIYFVWNKKYFCSLKYFLNLVKVFLLNFFCFLNKNEINKYPQIKTNDGFLGVLYSGMMDSSIILEGVKKIKNNQKIEIAVHLLAENSEYQITHDKMLFDLIEIMGFKIDSYHKK